MAAKPRKAQAAAHRAEVRAEHLAEVRADAEAASRPRFSTVSARRKDIHIIGVERGGLRDFYHWVLTIPWWVFYVCLIGTYLSLNLIFASLYWLDPGGVANTRPGSFLDVFFFSVETISTIGYGVMTPKSLYANIIMTAEAFTGLGMVAIATGLIFSRVSRPTARVLFSRIAVITPFDGVPALMFRAANQRGNQILEAEASVNLFGEVTTIEGHTMRRFEPLQLVRSRQPMFALSWTLMHLIDETSPLYGATEESLQAGSAEIIVAVSGVDEIFAQRIYARHSYLPDEIIWNRRLADVLTTNEDGDRVLNYYNFHKLMELPDEPSH
jgi:inward rectifier potassium channel